MATENIPRDVKDVFYRYKMPALVAKVEGRGNGIKTVIVNMSDIGKSLERSPAYITKFFGFELGALTTIDPEKDRFIVNGKHDQQKLAQVLDDFIERFVLCHKCGRNPETKMMIQGGNIELKCMACGNRSPVDMRHKLTTYILKNPPSKAGVGAGAGVGAEEAAKRKTKAPKTPKKSKNSSSDEENGKQNGDKKEVDAKPKSSARKKKPADEEEEEDVVWFTDTSREAAEQRRRQMLDDTSELASKLVLADESPSKTAADPITKLANFISTENPSSERLFAEVQKVKEEEKWGDDKATKVVFELLFKDTDVLKQLKTLKAATLKKFMGTPKAQQGLLSALEEMYGTDEAKLKSVPHIMKALYDQDLLEEDAILKWHGARSTHPQSQKVKDAAKVLVDWLRSAEEESDDEEA